MGWLLKKQNRAIYDIYKGLDKINIKIMPKKYWIFLLVIIVVGFLVALAVKSGSNKNRAEYSNSDSNKNSEMEFLFDPNSQGVTMDIAATSTSPKLQVYSKTSVQYTKAVNQYQYRIQFNQCHGVVNIPNAGTLNIARGTKFMLDNRDPVPHIFAFKNQSVRIAGYGYAIVTPTVLGIYPIICDGGGAVTLHVQ